MNDEIVQATFDYGILDEDTRIFVRVKANAIHARLKRTAEDIVLIGEDLIAVQEKLRGENEGHGFRGENKGNGNFISWLKSEFDMTDRTAYNFMSVAKKFGGKFEIISNFPPRILYALASASDQTVERVIEKVNSQIISPDDYEAIKSELKIAKEEERIAKQAQGEAEKKAATIQQQLNLFTQLSNEKIDILAQQIHELEEKLSIAATSTIREVTPPYILDKIKNLEELNKKQKERNNMLSDHIEKLGIELQNQRDANETRRKQEEYEIGIKQEWKKATEALFKAFSEFLGKIPSPIATQVFEGEEWARYDKIDQAFKQLYEVFTKIKTTRYGNQFIESSEVQSLEVVQQ